MVDYDKNEPKTECFIHTPQGLVRKIKMENEIPIGEKIDHLGCSVCRKQLTDFYDEGGKGNLQLRHQHFIEIKRSNYALQDIEGEIVSSLENLKMNRHLCTGCFVKILNESKTLGKLFFENSSNKFLF